MLYILANWKWLAGIIASGVLAVLLLISHASERHYRKLAVQQAATIAQITVAQKAAQVAAQAAHYAQESHSKDQANVIQAAKVQQDTVVHAAIADWADAHRVPACAAGRPAGGSASATSDRDTGVSASLPADPVILSADDLQACAGAVTYSLAARDWAATLNP